MAPLASVRSDFRRVLYGLQYTCTVFDFYALPFPTTETDRGILSLTDPTAVTPEPSSLLLLSTGLAGGLALLRRRLVQPS